MQFVGPAGHFLTLIGKTVALGSHGSRYDRRINIKKVAALLVSDREAYGGQQWGFKHVTNPGNLENEDVSIFVQSNFQSTCNINEQMVRPSWTLPFYKLSLKMDRQTPSNVSPMCSRCANKSPDGSPSDPVGGDPWEPKLSHGIVAFFSSILH